MGPKGGSFFTAVALKLMPKHRALIIIYFSLQEVGYRIWPGRGAQSGTRRSPTHRAQATGGNQAIRVSDFRSRRPRRPKCGAELLRRKKKALACSFPTHVEQGSYQNPKCMHWALTSRRHRPPRSSQGETRLMKEGSPSGASKGTKIAPWALNISN